MIRIKALLKKSFVLIWSMILLALVACEGTETRNKVDDGVEKFTGKDQVEQLEKIKTDVQKSMDKQAERLKETE